MDATKLTGNLPAIDGSSLTGIASVAGDNAFALSGTANVSITSATDTKVTYNNEIFDVGGNVTSSTFTVPTGGAGKYLFNFHLGTYSNSNNISQIGMRFRKNGTAITTDLAYAVAATIRHLSSSHTVLLDLADGDYIETYCSLTGTSPFITFAFGTATYDGTWFSGCKISD